jgi:uncharacterized membrane protein YraQ (UPF0718 family)/YHS domain-containing protein
VTLALGVVWLDDIGRGLRQGCFMFWETLWALALGFILSGFVQAFVSRRSVERALGDHRPAAVARAAGYGMASSSCSYAAAAMAKSLFARGADMVSATVFMVASTNLVVELGVVLVVLIGWQFAVGELVGGAVMIVLLGALGGLLLRGRTVTDARARLGGAATGSGEGDDREDRRRRPWAQRLRDRGSWADAAGYTVGDLTMLRRELVVGFGVAGFLAALVPTHVWADAFVHGHGGWTTLENAAVGPLVAVASFVCSVGNIPLAAALWQGGISFGGVISFVFADLITLPLLFVYRRYYGTRLMLRMVGALYPVMVGGGLATQALFGATGLEPATRSPRAPAPAFRWDYTSWLDVAFLVVLAGVYALHKNRARLGGGGGLAIDPVCGMQVVAAAAPAAAAYRGRTWYFCSDRCRDRFAESPARWAGDGTGHTGTGHTGTGHTGTGRTGTGRPHRSAAPD